MRKRTHHKFPLRVPSNCLRNLFAQLAPINFQRKDTPFIGTLSVIQFSEKYIGTVSANQFSEKEDT